MIYFSVIFHSLAQRFNVNVKQFGNFVIVLRFRKGVF